eukprot:TRINITY_DN55433_c0_g1_i1.p1 TRINITY_DN55433_c0_g1~~TRINITY_DN55433_c0_g1_i1.p1  ORF type:complete len:167 (-),score=3.81 TRINITY_DN55433_c0_g1_i1:161-661(-)
MPSLTTPATPSLASRIATAREDASSFFLSVLAVSLGTSALINVGAGPAEAAETLNSAATAAAAHQSALPDAVHSLLPAMTLGFIPEGPFASEFWDNVGRFVIYFFTVFTGGLYSLVKPIVDLFKRPTTAVLLVIVLGGGFYVTYLTLSAMLGIDELPLELPVDQGL